MLQNDDVPSPGKNNFPQGYHLAWLEAHPARSLGWLRDRIADGFHIHHVDGNHQNDEPSNLILIDGADHMRLHGMAIKDGITAWRKRPRKAVKQVERKAPKPARNIEVTEIVGRNAVATKREGYAEALAYGRELADHGVAVDTIARRVAEKYADQIGGWAAACSISRVVVRNA